MVPWSVTSTDQKPRAFGSAGSSVLNRSENTGPLSILGAQHQTYRPWRSMSALIEALPIGARSRLRIIATLPAPYAAKPGQPPHPAGPGARLWAAEAPR